MNIFTFVDFDPDFIGVRLWGVYRNRGLTTLGVETLFFLELFSWGEENERLVFWRSSWCLNRA